MLIITASESPAKIQAVRLSFQAMFPNMQFEVKGFPASSDVSAQPMSRAETEKGAQNRARHAKSGHPQADFWVGIEGGLEDCNGKLRSTVAIVVIDKKGRIGTGNCGSFVLPEKVAKLVQSGKELGQADDIVFGMTDSKKGLGAVGILTGGALPRAEYYTQGIILALIPFINPKLY